MALPVGLVTFLLTDVESSTALGRNDAGAAGVAMRQQAEIVADAVAGHDGVQPVEQGEGDSTVSVFTDPQAALAAALDVQRGLAADGGAGMRMGVHTGTA